MKLKKDPRDVTYNFNGANYVGSYDSEGNYHPPCQLKDQTSAEIDRLKALVSELEDKVEELTKSQKSNESCEEKPLIKDEKIRKAVRAWWNIQENPFKCASVLCKSYSGISNNKDHDGFYNYCIYGYVGRGNINLTATDFEFRTKTYFKYDRDKDYTLAELCGEEEE